MERNQFVKCLECSSRNIFLDDLRGERTCSDCGYVLEENIVDEGPDWRVFDKSHEERVHSGAPMNVLIHDKGLSTDLDWRNVDYSGKALKGASRMQFHRMRKWQRRARVNRAIERNLTEALSEIERMCQRMELNKLVRQEAAVMYRRALELNIIRGRSISSMVAASIYIANQKLGTARSLDDIVKGTGVKRKPLTKAYKVLKSELRLRVDPITPEVYLDRYISMLGMNSASKQQALNLIVRGRELDLVDGRSPTGVTAACIYIAGRMTNNIRTQREISDISGVTEVTIRNRYKEICTAMEINLE